MPVIITSCLKTVQNTISLFLFVIYLFFPRRKEYVFSFLQIKVRRKGTISHQEEWVRVDKDTEKPRTWMVISPRILIKRTMHLQTHQDSWRWWMAGTGLGGELQTQKSNSCLIKQNSEEINGLLKTKQQSGDCSQESLSPKPWANQKIQ